MSRLCELIVDKQGTGLNDGMKNLNRCLKYCAGGVSLSTLLLSAFSAQLSAETFPDPLPAEPIMVSESLNTPYPPSYAVVHDFAFGSLMDSAFSLVDTHTGRFKGMMSAGNFATFDVSVNRQEMYVGETYYSRGSRGERSDLITVYDMKNLERLAEIELPPKRAAIVVNKGATGITESGKFMLVFNLTPATSVSVIDLDSRKVVNEIESPGCSLVYPTVKDDFFMLCGDGAALFVSLDGSGQVKKQSKSKPFIDIDNDPLSEKSSKIGDTWFFVSFHGNLQTISAKGEPLDTWSLLSNKERSKGWRPAGWHWTASHPDGRLWVGMTPDGYEGSHKDPASEVWLFDTRKKTRLSRMKLNELAIAIDVSLEEEPRLLVVNAAGALDVYNAQTGKYQNSVMDLGASPYQVHRLQ
jgi:methylamine dehydrogenase heavy chain